MDRLCTATAGSHFQQQSSSCDRNRVKAYHVETPARVSMVLSEITILINGMPFTRESSAPELKSEATKGDIGKREGLFRIDGCLEELENEMRRRDNQREG